MTVRIVVFLTLLILLQTKIDTGYCQRLQNPPPLEHERRVAIAREVLAGVYPDSDPGKPERRQTEYRVLIDPVETVEYILANPPIDDGIGWDYKAVVHLLLDPQQLTDDQIIQLIDSQEHSFGWVIYMKAIANQELRDRPELHEQLKAKFRNRKFNDSKRDLRSILYQIEIAKGLQMTELESTLRESLQRYFSSGDAMKEYRAIQDIKHDSGSNADPARFNFLLNAPSEFRQDFSEAVLPARHVSILFWQSKLSEAEKLTELKKSIAVGLGQFSHEYMPFANMFGEIGRLDLALAEQTLERLEAGARCWARLNLAVGSVDSHPARASHHLRMAYQELEHLLQFGDQNERAYNYPLALIGAIGLRAVEIVEPQLIEDMIKKVVAMAPPMLRSDMGNSRSNYFMVAAGLARYDQQQAKELFDRASDQVDLHSVAGYFAALAALDPQQILEQYQQTPAAPDARGISWRPYIRNAIIPALCASDDDRFWDQLGQSTFRIRIPNTAAD